MNDTTAPVVTVPADITAPATGPSGAVGSLTVTAVDNVDGALPAICAPASGSTFPVGVTTVKCTATDVAGNPGSASFTVTVKAVAPVVDGTAPVVTVPGDMTVPGTESRGCGGYVQCVGG